MLINGYEEQPRASSELPPSGVSLCLVLVGWPTGSPDEGTAQGPGFPPSLGLGAAEDWNAEWEEGLWGPLEETPRIGRVAPLFVSLFLCVLSAVGRGRPGRTSETGSMKRTGISQLLPFRREGGHPRRHRSHQVPGANHSSQS